MNEDEEKGIEVEVGRLPGKRRSGWIKLSQAFQQDPDQKDKELETKQKILTLWQRIADIH